MPNHPNSRRRIPLRVNFAALLLLWLIAGCLAMSADPLPGLRPLPAFAPEPEQLARLSRTATVLNRASAGQRGRLHIMFYGQSITIQSWWVTVSTELRKRFPNVDFTIENRAISGFEAEELLFTVGPDIIDAQPDLVILHCYGFESGMDRLMRRIHDGTTADVIIQRDHPLYSTDLTEPTDPQVVTEATWWAYRNYVTLPRLCAQYGFCLADVRGLFKDYVLTNRIRVSDLLADATHPNAEGNLLMAEGILRYLTAGPPVSPFDPDDNPRTRTLRLPPDVPLSDRVFEVDFSGTRVDVLLKRPSNGSYRATIDGIAPSAWPALTRFTRSSSCLGVPWPAIMTFGRATNLVTEDWTLTLVEVVGRADEFRFRLEGSQTGFDGEGSSTNAFRSNSGRVSIAADSWWIPFAARHSQLTPPKGFQVVWRSVLRGTDRITALDEFADEEVAITVADGLPEGRHRLRLELEQGGPNRIQGVRAYSPAASAAVGRFDWPLPSRIDGFQILGLSTGPVLAWPKLLSVQGVEWTEHPNDPGGWKPLTVPWQSTGDTVLAVPGVSPGPRFFRLRY